MFPENLDKFKWDMDINVRKHTYNNYVIVPTTR